MSYQVIDRRVDPQTVEDLKGPEVLTRTLQNGLVSMSHQPNFRRRSGFLRRVVLSLAIVAVSSSGLLQNARGQSPATAPPYGPAHVGGYDPIKEEFDRRQPRTFFPRRTFGPAKE